MFVAITTCRTGLSQASGSFLVQTRPQKTPSSGNFILNSWGDEFPMTPENKLFYVTDNILVQERQVGAHFGDFTSN